MEYKLKESIVLLKERVKKYMKSYDREYVKDYIRENCNEEYRKKLIGAKLLLNNSFVFDDNWDMEQYTIPYVNDPIKWDYTPNGDDEWIFMLNRHEYLNKLIIAYYIEEDKIYLDKWINIVLNWIENNEINIRGGNTIRTIDTGIRCQSWISGLLHLINEEKICDEDLLKIIKSIKEQLEYLKEAYIGKYILSNWGVLQTTSIASCYLWLNEFINNEELFNWALEQNYAQLKIQVFDDGSHWEQSVMYHVEVLNCSMKLIDTCEILDFPLKGEYKDIVHSMARYLMHCANPKNIQEAQGDSDRTDIRDILGRGAILFNDKELKWLSSNGFNLDNIFAVGKKGHSKFCMIEDEKPKKLNNFCDDSGNIYMRSDFDENASFTYIKNGTLGSGHGHVDLGHFSLFYNGEAFFVDSGRYTYLEDDIMRIYFKSAKAHNVSVIDEEPFGMPKGSWGYTKYADTLKNYFKAKENISYVEAPYLAKLNDGSNYIAIRKMLFIAPNIWVVVSDIRCTGNHQCKNYYNLDVNVSIEKCGKYILLENNNSKLRMYNYNIDSSEIKNSYIAPSYNAICNGKRIENKVEFKDYMRSYDIIIGEKDGQNIVIEEAEVTQFANSVAVDSDKVIAKTIKLDEKESYTFIIFNEEIYSGSKMHFCKGEAIYGKVVIIHEVDKIKNVIRMRG